jgi:hypothetical protein
VSGKIDGNIAITGTHILKLRDDVLLNIFDFGNDFGNLISKILIGGDHPMIKSFDQVNSILNIQFVFLKPHIMIFNILL